MEDIKSFDGLKKVDEMPLTFVKEEFLQIKH
jgi:hypothetical protein